MKKFNCLIVLGVFAALAACHREEIPTYADNTSDRYIYFARSSKDSLDLSFFTYPGQTSFEFPFVVKSSGYSTADRPFKLTVQKEGTTAEAGNIELPQTTIMRGAISSDTCYVRFKYSPNLDAEKVRIVLSLETNEYFKVGPTESSTAIIWLHNMAVKPEWWTSTVASYYMGPYTEKKYREFMNVVKVDLTGADNNIIRHYALVFKQYLADCKAAGAPVLEEDGTEMTVVAGGK